MLIRSLALVAALLWMPLASPAAWGETNKTRSPWRVEVRGAREPAKVLRTIRRRRGPFLGCLKRTMTRRRLGSLQGKLAARFVIERAGSVRAVRKVKSSFKYPEVDRCLLRQVGKLRFAPASGETQVRYTWQLERIL